MKRAVWRIVVVALLALATFIPAVAYARGEDSDNGCPPRSTQGADHASATALTQTDPINPPANANAWVGTNPGKK